MRIVNVNRLLFLIMLISASISGTAYARSVSATLYVGVRVVGTCTVSASSVDFGTYNGSSDMTANGEVVCNCPAGTPYQVTLDAGLNYNGSLRRVSDGSGNSLDYSLYKPDSGEWGDQNYGDTFASGTSLSFTGNGDNQSHTVKGYLPGGYEVPAGSYTDRVTVSVYY